ncbi:MAG: cobalt-precorrin 5A hydrolase [Chloroflexota bacterium]
MPEPELGRIALLAVSRPGSDLALRLCRSLPAAQSFLPERFAPSEQVGVHAWAGSPRQQIARLFAEFAGLVVFGSVGMTVRLLAPHVADKRTDPAVVVVDDAGRFAVSVLSGHLGGANELALRVAAALGAQPVVTTASEVLETVAVDLVGRRYGWRVEGREDITRVSAALVNGEAVGLYRDAGERDWWPAAKPLPANLSPVACLDDLVGGAWQAALIITDRLLADWERRLPPCVIYRPLSLVVGVGCNRGATAEEIETAIRTALERYGLTAASIGKFATIDVKRDEAGLQELAARWGIPVAYFSAAELASVALTPNPSATVRKWVGTPGVAEPAALLASGAEALVVPKTKTTNVAVAIARTVYS